MIKRDLYYTRPDGINLYKTYSDENYYIEQEQTGIKYKSAIDVENTLYTYIETNIPIPEHKELERKTLKEARPNGHN